MDSIPPNGGSGIDASKKLELPPTKRDDLKAPSKKSGSTIKKEKPKQMPPKVKGAEMWQDCPAEFLKYAKEGMVSARVTIPGPGFVLKEAGYQGGLFITDPSTALPRLRSGQVGTRAPEASEKLDSALSSTTLGTRKNSSSTTSKSNRISPKPKGKSK